MIDPGFWRGRRVLLTGHTGFKGSWMALWLKRLGANVSGCSLEPPSDQNLFSLLAPIEGVDHHIQDIRDGAGLAGLVREARPEVVIHMAAQSLVRYSYAAPAETYETNVMGTLNLLEAVRATDSVRVCLVVTTDKCYENREQDYAYSEQDPLGGYDPYSSSKACAEIVTASWRRSFLPAARTAVATARAGNVVGGGDWAGDRLVPDFLRALAAGETLRVRNPDAVRPWQHVLEPLSGYLSLCQALAADPERFSRAWNFGPNEGSVVTVATLADALVEDWGEGARWERDSAEQPHEAQLLMLDSGEARAQLNWCPRLDFAATIRAVVDWYRRQAGGADATALCLEQIAQYEAMA